VFLPVVTFPHLEEPDMSIAGLRTGPGAEASQTGVVVGRLSTGAGELEEVSLARLTAAMGLTAAASAPSSLTGDYSDGTVLANLVALLAARGVLTDATTP
jgi:hypothetical protein